MLGIYIGAGLCNRIFQMVFGYAFAKKHHLQFRFEGWKVQNHHSKQVYEWLVERFMEQPNYVKEPVSYDLEYKEPGEKFTHCLEWKDLLQDTKEKNALVYGFFQNEEYFSEYREDILHLLREPEAITRGIHETFHVELPHLDDAFFLHIRLGDYLLLEKHWIHLEKYYIQAIQKIKEKHPNAIFVLFCNFPKEIPRIYPRLLEFLKNMRYMMVLDKDEVLNFYLMIRCRKGGICANSTFGWWAGWLNTNPDKEVYMPSRWFTGVDEIRIYPKGATILEC